jgi:biotin operon repressor
MKPGKVGVEMNRKLTVSDGIIRRTLMARGLKRFVLSTSVSALTTIFVLVACSAPQNQNSQENAGQQTTATDWKPVEQALGKAGSMQPGDVYKVSLPRSDLKVTVGGVELKPALALGSWVAFKKAGDMTMVMGDLVLSEDEVTPVITKLEESGVEVTALHNHILHESPRVMYMHIHAMGDGTKIAKLIHDALALSKTPFTAAAAPSPTQDIGIETKQIDQIIGQTGKANGVVFQYSIARADDVNDGSMSGSVIPPAMGVAQAINFQSTGGGKAAITGDFVLIASEVNPVIKALRDNGIEVTALHSHMLTDSPHLFFMHFWANDDAQKLARGLRAALDKVNTKKA